MLVVFVSAQPVFAQSMTRTERIELANSAFVAGNWTVVAEQTDEILNRWPKDDDALLLQAKLYVFGDKIDADRAEKAINQLPRSVRNQTEVRALSLWIDYFYGKSFMPSVKLVLQERRANKIIQEDELEPLANLVAGSIKLEDYRDQHNAVRFGIGTNLDQLIAVLGQAGGAEKPYVTAEGVNSIEIPMVRDESVEQKTGEEAQAFLLRAAQNGPLREIAFRELAETIVRQKYFDVLRASSRAFIRDFPEKAAGYLVLGMSQFMQGYAAEASIQFEKGIQYLNERDRWAMDNPAQIASSRVADQFSVEGDSLSTEYWARMDHLWSSPINERLVEHRARLIFADLMWGRPQQDVRGWETEPGGVIVRYGWPSIELQFQDGDGRYYYMDYGYRYWVFLDAFKSDQYTLWSPPGGSIAASRLCDRGRGGVDMERCSVEWFRDDPERTQRNENKRVLMAALPSVFENGTTRTVILPICFPETDQLPGSFVTIFDRKTGREIPEYGRSIRFENREQHWSEMPCDRAQVVAQQVDMGARQISVEAEGLQNYSTFRLDVPEAKTANRLRLSNLLLARLVEESDEPDSASVSAQSDVTGLSFSRFGRTIYPVARPEFKSGTPIYLYLESYGLTPDAESELAFQAALVSGALTEDTTPRLSQIFGKQEKPVVSVEFSQNVTSSLDARYFILETTDVEPGTYVLAVRVIEKRTGFQEIISREIRIK